MFFSNLYKLPVFSVIAIVFLIACSPMSPSDSNKSSMLLSDDEFISLLVDFALAESASNINVKSLPVAKMDSAYAFNPLKENNISKAKYDSTISFYSKHPALYKKIYERVLEELSKKQINKDSLIVK